jgi:hypothetical protein
VAESELDSLIAQLSDSEKAAERRKAAKRLGELRDPAAIDALANAYYDDEDDSVKQAAAAALRVYRQMQIARDAGDDHHDPMESAARAPSPLRIPLIISLVALIAANVFVMAGRGISGAIANQPTPVPATNRTALVIEAQTRFATLEAEAVALRQPLLDLQVDVESLRRLPRCAVLPESQTLTRALAEADITTYPDLAIIFSTLNSGIEKFRALRAKYADACAQTDLPTLDQRLQLEGGAAGLVAQLDALINGEIGTLRIGIDQAVNAPPPTTPAPSAPTEIAQATLPPPTTAADPAALTPTAEAALDETPDAPPTPAQLPTAVVVQPTAPPVAAISYQGVQLAGRARFRYRLTVDYEALTPQNRTVRGALSLRVLTEKGETSSGRYEISLRDDPEVAGFVGWLPDAFYQQGNAFYTALDGVFYHTGAGLPPTTTCTAEPIGIANVGVLSTLDLDALIGRIAPPNLLAIWQNAPPAGGKPQYRAEFVTQDGDGVQISLVATLILGLDGAPEQLTIRETRRAPSGYAKLLMRERTLNYTLQAADAAVNLAEIAQILEPVCRSVTPNAP